MSLNNNIMYIFYILFMHNIYINYIFLRLIYKEILYRLYIYVANTRFNLNPS